MRTGSFANSLCAGAALCVALAAMTSARAETLKVYTGSWPPFVRAEGEPVGTAADVVRKVLRNMGHDASFEHFGFAFGYHAVKMGRAPGAFPYFETRARRDEVLFSRPLFTVRNTVYYNLQFREFTRDPVDPAQLRVGRVTGYSYGEGLDAALSACPVSDAVRCPTFGSEIDAVRALLGNRIDLLPMTDSVATAILANNFPDEAELLREVPLEAYSSESTLHLIAPRNAEGRALIEAFDASHAELLSAGVLAAADTGRVVERADGTSVVRIVASEGFPIVVGVAADDPDRYYAVPEGTRALVLAWSDKLSQPASDDRLYGVMVDLSLVVILDGPHVGRELRIRNMHLSIDE